MANSINADIARLATVASDLSQVTGTLNDSLQYFRDTVVKPRTQLVTRQLSNEDDGPLP